MGRRMCALALGIVVAQTAGAQSMTHVVQQGDTLSEIAARYSVNTIDLAHANGINSIHELKLGYPLFIPARLHPKAPFDLKVRAGLQALAEETGPVANLVLVATVGRLTVASRPPVQVAAKAKTTAPAAAKAAAKPPAQIALKAAPLPVVKTAKPRNTSTSIVALAKPAAKTNGGAYRIVKGDNDWVIAKKFSTKPSLVRAANPNVDWTRLKIGAAIRLPDGTTKVAAKSASGVAKIRTRRALIAKDAVNIRRGPGSTHDVVTTVDRGTSVTVLDRDSDWYKLKFPRGTVGWVRGDMLKPLSASAVAKARSSKSKRSAARNYRSAPKTAYSAKTGNAVVDNALALMGTRYRYGSASRSGTDCSGLTTQVYNKLGVKLPRTSRQQSKTGAPVAKSDLEPGDLVFFHTGRSSRVNHVGIYKGNGKFVHASSAKGRVREDSLGDGYYSGRYVGARRPAGSKTSAKPPEKPAVKKEAAEPKDTASSKPIGEHKAADGDGGTK